jgi:hypothetical protein
MFRVPFRAVVPDGRRIEIDEWGFLWLKNA